MNHFSILYPIAALAGLTFAVLLLIPFQRFKAAGQKRVVANDFKLGESANVPPEVSIPNRNYMNLLELPLLFYVVCLGIFVTQAATPRGVAFAWTYVALRALHSGVHLTYNKVLHRLVFFALSNVVLITLWVQWILFLSR
jgi:hypothetical protein